MKLEHLHSFLAVAQAGGFREAMRTTGRSQPTLSQHIARLEADFGVPLLQRHHSGSVLTEQGLLLREYAGSALAMLEKAREALTRQRITIGASSNIGVYLLPQLLDACRTQMAVDNIEVRISDNLQIAEALQQRQIDIALMEWWDNRPHFVAAPWCSDALVVIVSPRHPWAQWSSIPAQQLHGQTLIGGESASGTGRVLADALGPLADSLRVGLQLGSTEAVKRAVRANLGISIVMAASVREEVEQGQLHALTLEDCLLQKQLYLVHGDFWPVHSQVCRFAGLAMQQRN